MPPVSRLSSPTTYFFLLVFGLPFFVGLETSSVWDSNEAFYVQTPREMLEGSNWLIPQFNFRPRLDKPPLSYWLVGMLYKAFGVSLYWERLTMALLAFGSILGVFRIGCLLFSERIALLGAGVFATTFRFLVLSRRLLIDILLLFCILLAVLFFLQWVRSLKNRDFLLCVLFLALGCLAKGPVSLLPVFFLFVYLFFSGRYRQLFSAPLLSAGGLFLVVTTPWYLLVGFYSDWKSVSSFLLRENLGRFTHLEFGPARGYFYYAGVLAGDFFPWSLLLAAAVVWWVKAGQSKSRKSDRRSLHLLFLWIALWIVVFSLSHNKQEYYILPVYPAAALVVAFFLQKVRARGYLVLAFGSLTMLLGVGLLLLGRSLFPDVPGLWLPLLLVLPFPILAFGGRWHAAILSLSLFYASAFWIYLDPLERYRPIRHFSQLILEREASRGGPYAVGYYRQASPSLVFYLKRPVLEPYDLPEAVQLLNRPDRLYLVIRDDEFDRLQLGTQVQLEILDARPQLATRGSVILEHLTSGELSPRGWTNTVLLITNFPTGTEE